MIYLNINALLSLKAAIAETLYCCNTPTEDDMCYMYKTILLQHAHRGHAHIERHVLCITLYCYNTPTRAVAEP